MKSTLGHQQPLSNLRLFLQAVYHTKTKTTYQFQMWEPHIVPVNNTSNGPSYQYIKQNMYLRIWGAYNRTHLLAPWQPEKHPRRRPSDSNGSHIGAPFYGSSIHQSNRAPMFEHAFRRMGRIIRSPEFVSLKRFVLHCIIKMHASKEVGMNQTTVQTDDT